MSQQEHCTQAEQTLEERCEGLIMDLQKTERSMRSVVTVVKKCYTDLPTSKEAVGIKESDELSTVREKMTKDLVLYKDFHLPLSIATVNAVVRTLNTYFTKDFDTFKECLPMVKDSVNADIEHAWFVHEMYVMLAVELDVLRMDAGKALNVAKMAAQDASQAAQTRAKLAKNVSIVSAGWTGVAVTVGVVTACGLVGPGGLLFAPALAPLALSAGTTIGAAGNYICTQIASSLSIEAKQSARVSEKLNEACHVHDEVLKVSLVQFADCLRGCAEFFQDLGCRLTNVDENLDMMDPENSYPDKALRAHYNSIQGQANNLLAACQRYITSTTQLEVDIGVLDRFEMECYTSYIDEWYKKCPSKRKTMKSTRALLRKALKRPLLE